MVLLFSIIRPKNVDILQFMSDEDEVFEDQRLKTLDFLANSIWAYYR